ncbi:hypothetical protein QN277_014352 [Acacia crassicarpa]|uniref:Uncharacterized protein n=1 Tax=Acacia crassicarpa TaxID=499986 RepID=A0AAE1M5Q0_9FABA|nr:hypothetical protein QN277_014352 [Acacia crassicarpa]
MDYMAKQCILMFRSFASSSPNFSPSGDNPESANRMRDIRQRKKKGFNTRTSQEVTHPSTTLAQARLTAEF